MRVLELALISIKIIDGPIDQDMLNAIVDTYGGTNARFNDPNFTDRFFNKNPFGESYHAFIMDGDRPVGHLGILPVNIWDGTKIIRSGKGEALFIDEAYRKTVINGVPAAMALLSTIHAYAFTRGIIMQHNIAAYDVGILYQWNQFERIIFQRDLYRHYLSYNNNASAKFKQLVFSVVWFIQKVNRLIIKLVLLLLGRSKSFNHSTNDPAIESVIKSYMGRLPRNKWAIALDRDSFNWRKSIGLLKIYSLKNIPGSSVLVTTGKVWEIIDWQMTGSKLFDRVAMLSMILDEARISDATELIVNKDFPQNNPDIKSALRLLGFINRSMRAKLFVRSDEMVYKSPKNIEFNNLLYFT